MVVGRKDGTQNSIQRLRRPSVFSSGFRTTGPGSQIYDSDFDDLINDNDKTVINQSQQVLFIAMSRKLKKLQKMG